MSIYSYIKKLLFGLSTRKIKKFRQTEHYSKEVENWLLFDEIWNQFMCQCWLYSFRGITSDGSVILKSVNGKTRVVQWGSYDSSHMENESLIQRNAKINKL